MLLFVSAGKPTGTVSTKGENINICWSSDGHTIAVGNKVILESWLSLLIAFQSLGSLDLSLTHTHRCVHTHERIITNAASFTVTWLLGDLGCIC